MLPDKENTVEDLKDFVNKIVAKSAARCMVGAEAFDNPDLLHVFRNYSNQLEAFGVKSRFLPGFLRKLYAKSIFSAISVLDNILIPIIETRRKAQQDPENKPVDFLQFYMDEKDEHGNVYDAPTVVRQFGALIFASMSTTTMAINRSLHNGLETPELFEKVRAEFEELKKEKRANNESLDELNFEDLKKLKFTEGLIRESLRYDSFAFNPPRLVKKELTVDKYLIPQGYLLAVSQTINQSKWVENPEEFKPERFISNPQPKTFLGFGTGKHLCPGRFFAVSLSKLILYNLLNSYDLKPFIEGEKPMKYTEFGDTKFSIKKMKFVRL
jgi:cytochrome P450